MSRVHAIACIHFCVIGYVLVTNQPRGAREPALRRCAVLVCRAQAPLNHDFSLAIYGPFRDPYGEGRAAVKADGIIGRAAAARTRPLLKTPNPVAS